MLIRFSTRNYRQFKDGFDFSMEPDLKVKELDYSILTEKAGERTCMGLPSAVIYGPNASGKTNIIGAMDTMRSIVLRGNIRDAKDAAIPNKASSTLSLIPFSAAPAEPVGLSVAFTHRGLFIEYSLRMNLGKFMEQDYLRRIVSESLSVNDQEVFCRDGESLSLDGLASVKSFLNDPDLETIGVGLRKVAEKGLVQTELFLTNGFKTVFSKALAELVTEWFSERLMVICSADDTTFLKRRFAEPRREGPYLETALSDAAKMFGANANEMAFKTGEMGSSAVLCSIIQKESCSIALPAELYESHGTLRFLHEFPLAARALETGSVLAADEFGSSLHPMTLMNLINIFHNDEINLHNAQLIFNTNNPIFLNTNLFRRDEIRFVDREDKTHVSELYALSDFSTAGTSGASKGEGDMWNYLAGQYGAIRNVDFSALLEKQTAGAARNKVP